MSVSPKIEKPYQSPRALAYIKEYIDYFIALSIYSKKKCTIKGLINFFPTYAVLSFGYLAKIVLTDLKIFDYKMHKFLIEQGIRKKIYSLSSDDRLSDFDTAPDIYTQIASALDSHLDYITKNEKSLSRSNFYISFK